MSSSCKTTLKGAKSVTCATCWKPFTRYGTLGRLGKGFVNSDVARSTCTADFPLIIEHKCLYSVFKTVNDTPTQIIDKMYTHSLQGVANYSKNLLINEYDVRCCIRDCYICK